MKELLKVEGLSKCFKPDHCKVVNDVGFEVKKHEIFALLGPSGCGKTTTLRIIAGFEHSDEGKVHLNGKTLASSDQYTSPEDRGIGFVFQDYALFPHLSVFKNVLFGMRNIPREKRGEHAIELICMMGMREYMHRKPHELSGGQQQRVALARAIGPMPELILLDEPFSNLDAVLRQSTRDEVRLLLKKAGMSALLVTHDQEEALSFADRIAVMNEGRIEQIGTPEDVYYRPKTQFVAKFLGTTNLIPADANGAEAKTDIGQLTLNRPAQGKILVSIRPEHLTLHKDDNNAPGTSGEILSRDFKGHDITYRVRVKTRECLVHTDNRNTFQLGDRVKVSVLEPAVVLDKIEEDYSKVELLEVL
ncbi:MAG: ABC transporter ATP-binding protein [Balneolales bacterium]